MFNDNVKSGSCYRHIYLEAFGFSLGSALDLGVCSGGWEAAAADEERTRFGISTKLFDNFMSLIILFRNLQRFKTLKNVNFFLPSAETEFFVHVFWSLFCFALTRARSVKNVNKNEICQNRYIFQKWSKDVSCVNGPKSIV